ncbi:methyltransferase [Amycolatopsis solani]|uniref:methyltransferase n=1 Tax=Amycolatopsis solani TaxID=3028615 RepID=UPI0025AF3221|nr:methyltransferase [Amycolatopsis sp. MEP2-6]
MTEQTASKPAVSTMKELHGDSAFSDMIWLLSGLPIAYMLQTVAELGIADELVAEPLPVEELAERTGSDADALYRVLRGVATKGVFTEVAHRTFGLTPLGDILRSDVPNSLRDAFRMHGQQCMRDTYAETAYSVRTGKPAFEHVNGAPLFPYFAQRPDLKDLFASFTGTAALRMQLAAAETCDLTGVHRLVDVGELHGRLLATLLVRYPHLEAVYADQPFAVPGAEQAFREAGVAGRVEVVAGDYLRSIPPDGDVYLLPQLLHRLSDTDAVTVLAGIARVMSPAGKVLVIDPVLPEGDLPHLAKVLDCTQLLLGPIRDRTEAEFRELFEEAGLRLAGISGRALPSSVLVALPRPR